MHNIAIILPAYNEEQTIADCIKAFFCELPDAFFVIINNASTDDTFHQAEAALAEFSAQGIVINESRPGKGNAVRAGFGAVDAEMYLVVDADMTYPATKVHSLIQPVKDKVADMVVGDRLSGGDYKNENKRSFHGFGNILVCWLVNTIFRANLRDIMSGYRVLSRNFVRNYPILVEGFQIETDMTLHALDKRFSIVEVPVDYKDRPAGSSSKLNTFGDGSRVLLTIANIFRHYRPMAFFGGIAILIALLSLVTGMPVIEDWLEFRYIYHIPLAILASGLALLSCLFFVLALILDSIAYQHKLDFERQVEPSNKKNRREGSS
jgi:glycosyltransferase involved in cell wall biosynthesis